jgi:predicted RNA-binding protein
MIIQSDSYYANYEGRDQWRVKTESKISKYRTSFRSLLYDAFSVTNYIAYMTG